MGWEVLKPRIWIVCILYVFLVTLVVHAFSVGYNGFDVSAQIPGYADELEGSSVGDGIPVVDQITGLGNLVWKFFDMAFGIVSFNIVNDVGLPVELQWILWLMVFPIYVVIFIGLLPYIIEMLHIIWSGITGLIPG